MSFDFVISLVMIPFVVFLILRQEDRKFTWIGFGWTALITPVFTFFIIDGFFNNFKSFVDDTSTLLLIFFCCLGGLYFGYQGFKNNE